MTINEGGPAALTDGYAILGPGGMDIRDWFAGQALAGMSVEGGNRQAIVDDAWKMADAMLAARSKGSA